MVGVKRFAQLNSNDQTILSVIRALRHKYGKAGPTGMRLMIEPCPWSKLDWQVVDHSDGCCYFVEDVETQSQRHELSEGELHSLQHRHWVLA